MSAATSPETPEQNAAGTAPAQLFSRPGGGERALLLQVDDGSVDVEDALRELRALAASAGATVVDEAVHRRQRPDARYFVGKGKVEELADRLGRSGADLVLVNHTLSPAQERNLENALGQRVLDRVGLILDIFAQRARSHEGKLQVELAQLRHIASRLVRGWTHLERQKGGIGMRGPGETQLELDRRMLGHRIKQLEKRLGKVSRQREQGRQARKKQDLATVSLVGYTNAGKSTLFNRLAACGVHAADQLFATLDTTLRRIDLPAGEPAVLADTVGFIRDLPHQLVAAFRSTLEEVTEADLLLHVVDAADPARDDNIRHVESVLAEIGAGEMPVLRVFNKIDRIGVPPRIDRDGQGMPTAVWVSAVDDLGTADLLEAVEEAVGSARAHGVVELAPHEGRLRARFYALGEVLSETVTEDGHCRLEISIPRRDLDRLYSNEGLCAELWPSSAGLRQAHGGL
ncbi:MAG TPA: ribosome rescue GTPase HflX [Gammaproteobacteria bacterium]|nr:ribosome rescue GTPase HflX [Gammaproteobacteria bacterium]